MRYPGLSLSGAERRALAEYLTGKSFGGDITLADPAKGEEFLEQVRARAEEQRKRYAEQKKREQDERDQDGDAAS